MNPYRLAEEGLLHATALEFLDLAPGLAEELLGAESVQSGRLRGIMLGQDGRARGEGVVPSSGPDGAEVVPVGWSATWCAGERQVRIHADEHEAFGTCAPAEDCGAPAPERPVIDSPDAILAAWEDPSALYWLHMILETEQVWQVHAQTAEGYEVQRVDATTGELVP